MPNGLYIPQSTVGVTQQGITGLANIKETRRRGELEERRFAAQQEQIDYQQKFQGGQQRLKTINDLLPFADDQKFISLVNEINEVSESMGVGSFNINANKALSDRASFTKGLSDSSKLKKTNPEAAGEFFSDHIGKYQTDEQPQAPVEAPTAEVAAEGLYVSPTQRAATERERRGEVAEGVLAGKELLAFQESGKVPLRDGARGAARITDTKVEAGKKQDYESFDGGQTWKKWGDPYSTGKGAGAGGAADLKWHKDAGSRLDRQYGTLTDTGYVINEDRMAEYQDANTYLADYKTQGLNPNDAAVLAERRARAGGVDPIQTVIGQLRTQGKNDKEIKTMLRKSQFGSVNPRLYGLK